VWREWLTLWRFNVVEAEDGLAALARARDYPPDVVIMDVTMPRLDGFGAAERLKGDPATARVPVLLLSADTAAIAAKRAAPAGGDAFLSKPIRAMDLLQEIRRAFARLIAQQRARTPGAGDMPPH
jgi:CheY-like chemotaxis protein